MPKAKNMSLKIETLEDYKKENGYTHKPTTEERLIDAQEESKKQVKLLKRKKNGINRRSI